MRFRLPLATLDSLTIVLKAFERPRTVNRAVRRIRRYYPDIRILIADDSSVPLRIQDRRVDTPYFLLNDDDHFFSRHTDLETMVHLLEVCGLDVLGGRMWLRRRRHLCLAKSVVDTPVTLELDGETLRSVEVAVDERAPCTRCDLVPNFFVARTERIRATGGWDARLKVDEHIDFFLRAKGAGLAVGYTTRSSVDHVRGLERSRPRYLRFRQRAAEFRPFWMGSHGISTLINRHGTVIAAPR